MSLAKQLIGEPAPKVESKTPAQEAEEAKPVNAQELIDALAEQEFGLPESHSSTSVNTSNVTKKGKKDKGKPCAKAPGKVTYGKK
jgi:hypothetical protein